MREYKKPLLVIETLLATDIVTASGNEGNEIDNTITDTFSRSVVVD